MDLSALKFVIGYGRVSSDRDDRQTLGLGGQRRELRKTEQRTGVKISKMIEEEKSAYVTGREGFTEMMGMIESGKADAIITYHPTRIARNTYDGGRVIYAMDRGWLKAIITPEKVYTNNSDDKFLLQIHFAMAKKSSDDTSQFVIRDIETKLLKGEYPGFAPLGFVNVDENGKISGKQYNPEKQRMLETLGRPLKRVEIDPLEGPLVRKLFEEASRGVYSIKQLCRIGMKLGICARRGGKPAKSTIFKTLVCPFYYGAIRYQGKLYTENIQHEPLISKKLFTRVQTMIDRRGTGGQRSHVFAYTGMMRCGECGCAITAEIQRNHVYYHCTRTKGPCSQKRFIREETLEEQLKNVLMNLQIPQAFLSFAFEKTRKAHAKEVTLRDTSRRSLERRYDESKRRLDSLLQLKLSPKNVDGELLSDDEYLTQKQRIKTEMDDLNEQIKAQKDHGTVWIDDCERFITNTQEFCRRFENGTLEEKRELFLLVCSNITLKDEKVAFSYEEPFKSISEFALAQEPSFERQTSFPEKQGAVLIERWRG